tara:strand:- start:58867 stop:59043 length:177 start_codon:yes stop_codon:yes gene_type:complete
MQNQDKAQVLPIPWRLNKYSSQKSFLFLNWALKPKYFIDNPQSAKTLLKSTTSLLSIT